MDINIRHLHDITIQQLSIKFSITAFIQNQLLTITLKTIIPV